MWFFVALSLVRLVFAIIHLLVQTTWLDLFSDWISLGLYTFQVSLWAVGVIGSIFCLILLGCGYVFFLAAFTFHGNMIKA